ncbi:MAG: hypothetical protein V4629_06930 [Pseudomonadota bacterium]
MHQLSAAQRLLLPIGPEFYEQFPESYLGNVYPTNKPYFNQQFNTSNMRSADKKSYAKEEVVKEIKELTPEADPDKSKHRVTFSEEGIKIRVIPDLTSLPTEEKLELYYSEGELKEIKYDLFAKIFPPKNVNVFLKKLFSSEQIIVRREIENTINSICDWMESNQLNHRELFEALKINQDNTNNSDEIEDLKISYKKDLVKFERYKEIISHETKDLILNLIDEDCIFIPSAPKQHPNQVQNFEQIYNENITDAFIKEHLSKWVNFLTNEALAIL